MLPAYLGPWMPRNRILHRGALCLPTILLFLNATICATAKTLRYMLEERTTERGMVLRHYDVAAQHTVWQRTVGDIGKIGWSPDHRALAAIVFLNDPLLHLLIWRENHPPYIYALGSQGILGDNANDFAWSADRRRLLFRIGGSGSFDLNVGGLYALNVRSRRFYVVSEKLVRKMQWQGAYRVRYWIAREVPLKHPVNGGSLQLVTDPRPHLWYCP